MAMDGAKGISTSFHVHQIISISIFIENYRWKSKMCAFRPQQTEFLPQTHIFCQILETTKIQLFCILTSPIQKRILIINTRRWIAFLQFYST